MRRIDYWYLGAATLGLFLAAFGYSTQREAAIVKFNAKLYGAGELSVLATVNKEVDSLSIFLCQEMPRAKAVCDGLNKLAPEIRAGRSPAEIESISKRLTQDVILPFARIFPASELSKDPNLLLPVVSVQTKIQEWKEYAEEAPKTDVRRSKVDDETEVVLGRSMGDLALSTRLCARASHYQGNDQCV